MFDSLRSSLRQRTLLLWLAPLAFALGWLLWSSGQPPRYTASSKVLVQQDLDSTTIDALGQQLVFIYAELATSYPVRSGALQDLRIPIDPDQIAGQIEADPDGASGILTISFTSTTPEQAAELANALARQLLLQNPSGILGSSPLIEELRRQREALQLQIADTERQLAELDGQLSASPADAAMLQERALLQGRLDAWRASDAQLQSAYQQNSRVALALLEQARPPLGESGLPLWASTLLAALAGLACALPLALLLEARSRANQRVETLTAATPMHLVGTLPRLKQPLQDDAWSNIYGSAGQLSEGFESLLIALQIYAVRHDLKTIVLTSPSHRDQTGIIAVNLARAFAAQGQNVMVVDVWTERPALHTLFNMDLAPGLTTLLTDESAELVSMISAVAPNVAILPAGPRSKTLLADLQSERAELLLWLMGQTADRVILVASPAAAALLARHEACVVVTADLRESRPKDLRRVYKQLTAADATLLALMISGVQQRQRKPRKGPVEMYRHRRRIVTPMIPVLIGLYMMLYGGGIYANNLYEQQAARGDTPLQPQARISVAAGAPQALTMPEPPQSFSAPDLGSAPQPAEQGQQPLQRAENSTITRLRIPRIGVDTKVLEVFPEYGVDQGRLGWVWQVAKYTAGHHHGSANPGEGSNVVLAGHVGGEAPVFRDLIMLEPGDQIAIASGGQEYLYVVTGKLLVREVGVPDEVRDSNAEFMAETPEELVTLITCWPKEGPQSYTQRIIIRARPYGAELASSPTDISPEWQLR